MNMAEDLSELTDRWVESRPSRVSVAQTHLRRTINTWGNSKPYLSGDLFSDQADISFNTPKLRRIRPSLRQIREASVIFCPSHDVEYFFEKYKGYAKPKVLICGNSDRDFYSLPENLPKSIRHVFLQNSFIRNNNFNTGLPIGLENLRWGKNGYPRLMRRDTEWSEKANKVMVGPFGLTHPERYQVRETFESSNEILDLFKTRLSPKELSAIAQKYRFIAAVRGNGVDTHRHWETAYRGSYAIVKKNQWSENFSSYNLPFLEIDEWSIAELSRIIRKQESAPMDPRNVSALWWPYWKAEIGSKLSGV